MHSLIVCRGPGENSRMTWHLAEALEVQVHMVISVTERFKGQVAM